MMMGGPGGGGGMGPGPRGGGPGGMGLNNLADEDGVVYNPRVARRALAYLAPFRIDVLFVVLMTFVSAALLTVGPAHVPRLSACALFACSYSLPDLLCLPRPRLQPTLDHKPSYSNYSKPSPGKR